MQAYAMIGPFEENFSTTKMVTAIKEANITNFTQLWLKGSDELYIHKNEALYLYGGRKALEKALTDAPGRTFEGFQRNTMALYRAQRRVGISNTKTKQLFMLTIMPGNDDTLKRLWSRCVSSIGFGNSFGTSYLGGVIGNLPKLVVTN